MTTYRDPSIGKDWLAWHALHNGDEPKECVAEYLLAAQPRLGELIARVFHRGGELTHEDEHFLSGLHLVLLALAGAARRDSDFAMRIDIKKRTAGPLRRKTERANEERRAVRIVNERIAAGDQLEAAVQQAVEDTGVCRSEVFARLRIVRQEKVYLEAKREARARQKTGIVSLKP